MRMPCSGCGSHAIRPLSSYARFPHLSASRSQRRTNGLSRGGGSTGSPRYLEIRCYSGQGCWPGINERNSSCRIVKNGPNTSARVALVHSHAGKIRKTSSSSSPVHITHHNRYTMIDHQHQCISALARALPLALPLALPPPPPPPLALTRIPHTHPSCHSHRKRLVQR